ncbi:MAG TPA: hypothetical protein VD835_11760 [Pyrinomonadaceae bacterium]|nr:hypothetical protein [Pyrinomonadaceae bacterium]
MGEEGKTDADYAREQAQRDREYRRHEVLCLCLKELLSQNAGKSWLATDIVGRARTVANLAYPEAE